jgi:hypothetical protein
MFNSIKKMIALVALLTFGVFALAGCSGQDPEYTKRQEQNKQAASQSSLEKQNLAKKLKLEENPDRIGYVTVLAGVSGKPFGYYTVKGKISNSGSQLDPEDLVNCGRGQLPGTANYQDYCEVIDGPQDDGTYGTGDPGNFFFTTDGTYVEITTDYVYSSQPLPSALHIPKLG